MTHIRIDERTICLGVPGIENVWIAYCGAERPESSVSEAHMQEVFSGTIRPFCDSVRICPDCAQLLHQRGYA